MNGRRSSFSRSRLLLGLLASAVVGPGCSTMQIGAPVPPRISAQNVQYDGTSLRFLLVVESMADGTTIDRRLGSMSVALVGPPVACDSVTALPPLLRDQSPPASASGDLHTLEKGKRFAREVELFLFETAGPECIRAQVAMTNPPAEEPITIVGHSRSAARAP
ncbi:MAG TPA: hypothetical protein VFI53_02445 [Myxococcaceae bacterium]|nr:hypothetical protein [Myxococcaceae bacterium]